MLLLKFQLKVIVDRSKMKFDSSDMGQVGFIEQ